VTAAGFEAACAALVERERIDFVIPAHDDVALLFSRMRLPDGCRALGQSAEVNEIVRFKNHTYEALAGKVPAPHVFLPGEALRFPVFAKPSRGQGSKGTRRLDDTPAYDAFFREHAVADYVVAEYLPGAEFTIDCFSTDGDLRFSGPRTREQTVNGISVRSRPLPPGEHREALNAMARSISATLGMHGLWFFQARVAASGEPKLLEVGARVSGTMMVNRVRGVNFVELALYQALGFPVSVRAQDFDVCVTRSLQPRFHHDIAFGDLYVDFDDTLLLDDTRINTEVMALVFAAKNDGHRVCLITRNRNNKLASTLNRFGISSVFDAIHHLADGESKASYLKPGDLLVDDSFAEREQALDAGAHAIGLDAVQLFQPRLP
jgi:predicted ATP-grasp superfamily ATP-dependent carboligase